MDTHLMFVTRRSGLIIRPEGVELAIGYADHYIIHLTQLLTEYQREAIAARTVAPEGIPQEESIVAETLRELSRVEAFKAELEQVRGRIIQVYKRNFEDWADMFRQTRIQSELARIEDSPHLYALLQIVMSILKAENYRFSNAKFIKYINN